MKLVFSFKVHSVKYLLQNYTYNELLDYALYLDVLHSNIFNISFVDLSIYNTKSELALFIKVTEKSLCELCSVYYKDLPI